MCVVQGISSSSSSFYLRVKCVLYIVHLSVICNVPFLTENISSNLWKNIFYKGGICLRSTVQTLIKTKNLSNDYCLCIFVTDDKDLLMFEWMFQTTAFKPQLPMFEHANVWNIHSNIGMHSNIGGRSLNGCCPRIYTIIRSQII